MIIKILCSCMLKTINRKLAFDSFTISRSLKVSLSNVENPQKIIDTNQNFTLIILFYYFYISCFVSSLIFRFLGLDYRF